MNKTEIRESIYAGLLPIMSDKGYRLLRNDQSFVRTISEGKQAIGIPIIDHNPNYKLSLTASVRINRVEDIVHLFSGSPEKYHNATFTFGCTLDRFIPDQGSFNIRTFDDIEQTISRLAQVVRDQTLPFLDDHQELETLSKAMNLTALPDIVSGASPAMHAAVVARLTNNPGFLSIVTGYRERMSRLPKDFQERFDALVHYLNTALVDKS